MLFVYSVCCFCWLSFVVLECVFLVGMVVCFVFVLCFVSRFSRKSSKVRKATRNTTSEYNPEQKKSSETEKYASTTKNKKQLQLILPYLWRFFGWQGIRRMAPAKGRFQNHTLATKVGRRGVSPGEKPL